MSQFIYDSQLFVVRNRANQRSNCVCSPLWRLEDRYTECFYPES